MRFARVTALAMAAATTISLDARPAPLGAALASVTIVSRSNGVDALRLEGRRASLERCAAGALGEGGSGATSIGYDLRIEANGEVRHVDLTPRGRLSRGAEACFAKALAGAIFDPTGGGGLLLHGELLLGVPAPSSEIVSVPILGPDLGVVGATGDLQPLSLHARPPPPEGRAVDAAARAATACAAGARGRIRVRLLATESGALRRVAIDGDLPAPALGCVRTLLASAPPGRAATPERAVAVDVELLIEGGRVHVAR